MKKFLSQLAGQMAAGLVAVALATSFVACHDTPGTWGHHSGSDLPTYSTSGSTGSSSSGSSASGQTATIAYKSSDSRGGYINVEGGQYKTCTLSGNSRGGTITLSDGVLANLTGTYGTPDSTVALAAADSSVIEGSWSVTFQGITTTYSYSISVTNGHFAMKRTSSNGGEKFFSATLTGTESYGPATVVQVSAASLAGKTGRLVYEGDQSVADTPREYTISFSADGQSATLTGGGTTSTVTFDGDFLTFSNFPSSYYNKLMLRQVNGEYFLFAHRAVKTDSSSGLYGTYHWMDCDGTGTGSGGQGSIWAYTYYQDGKVVRRTIDPNFTGEPGDNDTSDRWWVWTCSDRGFVRYHLGAPSADNRLSDLWIYDGGSYVYALNWGLYSLQ